jgi:hypothetical protein
VTDKSRALAVTVVGAVIGGLAGFLFCTTQGRALLQRIEPALEDLSRELSGFGQTIIGTMNIAGETWNLLKEALSDAGNESPGRGAQPSSPF